MAKFTALTNLWAILLSLALFTSTARAGLIVIATDDPQMVVAKQFEQLLRTTPPFSRLLHLQIKVVYRKVTCAAPKTSIDQDQSAVRARYEKWARDNNQPQSKVEEMLRNLLPESCRSQQHHQEMEKSLSRTFVCESQDQLAAMKAQFGADRMIFIKVSKVMGGSGGDIPMASTTGNVGRSDHDNLTLALHEMLHTMGFEDEYEHQTACEADLYCRADHASANVVYTVPRKYKSEDDAREKLAALVPWLSSISDQPITRDGRGLFGNKVLAGTQTPAPTGLFPAKTCDLATQKLQSWRSSNRPSVMETLETNYIAEATWPAIAKALNDEISDQPAPNEHVFFTPYRVSPDKN